MQPNIVRLDAGPQSFGPCSIRFSASMAVAFIDDLWCRNLINLFSTPLMLSEYLAGIIVVCILKVIVGLTAASVIAWAAYSFDILPWLPKVHSLHREPVDLLACYRNRNHGNDLSLLDENPGAGVGVCGSADAGVVHIFIRSRRCRVGCRTSRG